MQSWFDQARRHAAEIHDVVQLAAGATAFAAVLVFVMLSGRSQDDPIVQWMAEVGATMAESEFIVPTVAANPEKVAAGTGATMISRKSLELPDALAYQPDRSWAARHAVSDAATTTPTAVIIGY